MDTKGGGWAVGAAGLVPVQQPDCRIGIGIGEGGLGQYHPG